MGGAASVAENCEEDSDDEDEIDKCLNIEDGDKIRGTDESKDTEDDGTNMNGEDERRENVEKSKGELLRERLRNSHPSGHDNETTNKAIELACQRAATRRSRAIEDARKKLNAIDLDTSAFEKAALAPLRNELKAIENEEEADALDLQQYEYSYDYEQQYSYRKRNSLKKMY